MGSREILSGDGRVVLFERCVPESAYDPLRQELDWRSESIRMFGKVISVPRLVTFYGEHAYTYSGIQHAARPLPPILESLRVIAEDRSGFRFNSVLGNWYRSGQDSMGYHRDNEPEIDPGCIASFSFGATRRFRLRHIESRRLVPVDLEDGSLLLMLDCQEQWEHALPRTRRPVGGRINLTFRSIRIPARRRVRTSARDGDGRSGA